MHDEHMTISLKSSKHMTPHSRPQWVRQLGRKFILLLFVVLVVVILFLVGHFVYSRATQGGVSLGDQTQVVDQVGKLMLLPDEKPTVAVVSDLNKLKGQQFFAHASQGDVVLMYAKAQKAILYSPAQNKIIEVAPITQGQ